MSANKTPRPGDQGSHRHECATMSVGLLCQTKAIVTWVPTSGGIRNASEPVFVYSPPGDEERVTVKEYVTCASPFVTINVMGFSPMSRLA